MALCAAPAYAATALPVAYEQAMGGLLVKGRRFTDAAKLLERAKKERTGDYHLPLALGCAYADRATSVSYAASFALSDASRQANLPREKRERRIFRLKDDGTPFKEIRDGTAARFSDRAGKASDAWGRGKICQRR